MPYGFSEATNATGGGNYIDDAGVYDAKLTSVAYENAKNDGSGKNILAFHFETTTGAQFRHIEWDIDENKVRETASKTYKRDQGLGKLKVGTDGKVPTEPQYVQRWLDGEFEAQGARIKHIASAYTPNPGAIQAGSYEDYAKKVSAFFKTLDTSGYHPLLVTYNTKDYAGLPRRAPFFGLTTEQLERKAIQAKYKMTRTPKDESEGYTPSGNDEEF